jgi:hypothetical protein
VGTNYLRAGYLPEPAASQSRDLLVEYVPLRIASDDLPTVISNVRRSVEIQDELWLIAEKLARATPDSEAVNESPREGRDGRWVAGVGRRSWMTLVRPPGRGYPARAAPWREHPGPGTPARDPRCLMR